MDEGEHLKDAVTQAGLDLAELETAITNGDHLEEVVRNQIVFTFEQQQ